MKNIILTTIFLIFQFTTDAQTWLNVQSTGSNSDDSGNAIYTDSLGNAYVAGNFADSIFLGGIKVKATGNSRDIFIAKYNTSMNVVWAKRFGGANNDDVYAIKTDFSGNIYITGSYYNSITFDSITIPQSTGPSMYIVKLNSTGTALWAKTAVATGSDFYPAGLALDAGNNIYISGYYAGIADFGNSITLSSIPHPQLLSPSIDIFIAKFNSSGNCQWARTGGSYATDRSLSLAVTGGGTAYITGFYGQTATFSGSTLTYNGGGTDAFFAGYNTNGGLVLLESAASGDYESGYGITLDPSSNIYITGLSSGPTLFDTATMIPHGSYDMFIAKYNANGNILWLNNTFSSQWEHGRHVAVDQAGNVYVGGEFYHNGTTSFPGTNFTSKGYTDPFIVKYNHTGEFQWAQRGGSYQYDYINGMALADSGNIIITGSYGDSARFSNFLLPHFGNLNSRDYFIGKLQNDITTESVTGLPSCAGSSVFIAFKTHIPFNPGNVFTAQLSDSEGRFANAVNIGTLTGILSGNILATIPVNTPSGNGYRIRIISTDSVRTGGDNGKSLTIWGLPVAAATSSGVNFCSGDSLLLTAAPGSGYIYQWKKNGINISGATSDFYYAKATADYKVKVTEPSHGCTKISNTIHTNLRAIPSANITPSSSTTFCSGGSVQLNASSGTNYSYQWKKYGNNIPNAINSAFTATSTGNYTVKVTSGYGCTKISSSVHVSVNPLPVVSFSGLASVYTSTDGPVSLTPLPTGGVFSGTGIAGYTFFPSIAGTGGPYTITYTYTDNNGCSNSVSQQTTVTCLVPAVPSTITVTGGNNKVCPGDSRTFTASLVNGATSYTWTPPFGGVISSGQGSSSIVIQFNAGFTTGDSLKVTANNACGSSTASSLFIQRNNPVSPASISGQNSGVCNLTGQIYSVAYVPGIVYAWSFVNGNSVAITSGQGTSAINVNYNAGFQADTLRVTANNSCGTSSNKKLSIKAVPATPGSIAGNTAVCANQQNVSYSISPVVTATNYTWTGPAGSHISDGTTTSTGTSLVTTATSVTVDYGSSGGNLKVRANNFCGSGNYKTRAISIICKEYTPDNDLDVIVSPNPSSDNFNFEITHAGNHRISVEIVDMIGKTVYITTTKKSVFSISNAQLLPGIYLAIIRAGEMQKTIKIIKGLQ